MIQLLQGMTPTWAVDQAFNSSITVPYERLLCFSSEHHDSAGLMVALRPL